MNIQELLDGHDLVLTEAAVIETLRRSGTVSLHPLLENALLIYDEAGRRALTGLYQDFIAVAREADTPILVCAPTWRANQERISKSKTTKNVNNDAVAFLRRLREGCGPWAANIMLGGLVGCRNDCYRPGEGLSTREARSFHSWQIARLAEAGVDLLLGATLPSVAEAKGIALAMEQTGIPYSISFVIDRAGRILDGSSLEQAFQEIDAACRRPPLGYLVNCAYPSFLPAHELPRSVLSRLIGYQANASSLDQSRLDNAETLQADDLADWGDRMIELNRTFGVKILGGCCGTGSGHLRYITRNLNRGNRRPPGAAVLPVLPKE